MSQLAQLQDDRAQYQEQLDLVLGSLRDDPGNADLLILKEELDSALKMIDDSMAELQPGTGNSGRNSKKSRASTPPPTTTTQSSADASHTASPAREPPSQSQPAQQQQQQQIYKVNESVLARWVSGDKAFYPSRIMSVTGSMTAPMYTVKFKSYDTIETLRAKDIRPLANNNNNGGSSSATAASSASASSASTSIKRRVDGADAASSAQPPPPLSPSAAAQPPPPPATAAAAFSRPIDRFNSGVVSSAAAKLYPQAALLQKGGDGDGGAEAEGPPPKKFKKIKATKQLEAGKSKWQEFNKKSKFAKSGTKKDSMFRTPEGINGRVGFTGSGQAMRKDPTRSKHIYAHNDEVE